MNIFMNSAGKQEGMPCVSTGVSLGDFVYVSAQYGQGNTIQEQVLTACNKVIDVLAHFELEMRHVVKFTLYVTDLKDQEMILKTLSNFVEEPFPALSLVQVAALPDQANVALEAMAINTLRYEKASQEHACHGGCDSCSGSCSH